MPGAAAKRLRPTPGTRRRPATDSTASFGATNGELSDGKYPSMIATAAAASAYPTAAAEPIAVAGCLHPLRRDASTGRVAGSGPATSAQLVEPRLEPSQDAPAVVGEVQLQDPARDHHVGARRPGGATSEMKAPGGAQQLLDGRAAVGIARSARRWTPEMPMVVVAARGS